MTVDALVWDHRYLVRSVINRCRVPHHLFDDCVSVGWEALFKATRTYDPSRGASFATHAWHTIRGAVAEFRRQQMRAVTPEVARALHSQPADDTTEAKILVRQILSRMSQEESDLLRAHFLEGKRYVDLFPTRAKANVSRTVHRVLRNAKDIAE